MYLRSDAWAHFELVHAQDIDLSYIEEDWKGRLPIVLMNSENNISWYGPYLEAIETLRDEYAADVVMNALSGQTDVLLEFLILGAQSGSSLARRLKLLAMMQVFHRTKLTDFSVKTRRIMTKI